MAQITNGDYDRGFLHRVTNAAGAFVAAQLEQCPDRRPLAAELLQHQWLAEAPWLSSSCVGDLDVAAADEDTASTAFSETGPDSDSSW